MVIQDITRAVARGCPVSPSPGRAWQMTTAALVHAKIMVGRSAPAMSGVIRVVPQPQPRPRHRPRAAWATVRWGPRPKHGRWVTNTRLPTSCAIKTKYIFVTGYLPVWPARTPRLPASSKMAMTPGGISRMSAQRRQHRQQRVAASKQVHLSNI